MNNGKVRIYPKRKAEPDLDQIVLALLRILDDNAAADRAAGSASEEPAS